MTDTADAAAHGAAVHRARRGRLRDGAGHRQPARSRRGGARDQAADARRRLHGAAHRRLPLQRPPAAHALPGHGGRARQVPHQPGQRRHRQAARRAVRHDLQGGGRSGQAGAHRRQRRLAQPGARARQDAGEHRPQPRARLGRDPQRVHGDLGGRVHGARHRVRAAQGPDHHLVQGVAAARPHRDLPRPRAPDRAAAAPRPHRGRHGPEGPGVVGVGDGHPAQRRHRRHHPRVADAAPRRRPARRGVRRLRAAAGARPPLVRAERDRLPGLRPHHEQHVPGAGRADAGLHPRAAARVEDPLRGRRNPDAGGDGMRRQRSRRVEGGQHRHQPARHRRGAELPDLHRRRARHDAARHLRRARRRLPRAHRRLRRHEVPLRAYEPAAQFVASRGRTPPSARHRATGVCAGDRPGRRCRWPRRSRASAAAPCRRSIWCRRAWRASRSTTGRSTPSSPSPPTRRSPTRRTMEAEARRGAWRGPLHGIPIALKDNIDTAGVRTTGASRLFEERVPRADAEVARRLKQAGAILLGKLNLHEFAYGGSLHRHRLRHHAQPVAPRPRHRRVVRRTGRRRRRGPVLRRRSAPTPPARFACRRRTAASSA